jgi:hypothetical protein
MFVLYMRLFLVFLIALFGLELVHALVAEAKPPRGGPPRTLILACRSQLHPRRSNNLPPSSQEPPPKMSVPKTMKAVQIVGVSNPHFPQLLTLAVQQTLRNQPGPRPRPQRPRHPHQNRRSVILPHRLRDCRGRLSRGPTPADSVS